MTHRDSIAGLLARFAYQEGAFQLSSGKPTTFYLDAKQVTYRPEGASLVGPAVLDLVRQYDVGAVGGLTMGADAIVASVVLASVQTCPIPGFVVRKEAKKHGLAKRIEGVDPRNLRVAIVDDVITSGNSILQAVECAKDVGAIVVVVVALVDRQEGGAEQIQKATGVPFHSVCTLADVRQAAASICAAA